MGHLTPHLQLASEVRAVLGLSPYPVGSELTLGVNVRIELLDGVGKLIDV